MNLPDRLTPNFVLDGEPTIGRILEHSHNSPMGSFTSQHEIVANTLPQSTLVVVTFMQGFKERCPWNDHHGKRSATQEEKDLARDWLSAMLLELSQPSDD